MNSRASAPSRTTCTWLARWCVLKACSASFTSLGLSSTSRISTGDSGIRRFETRESEEERRPFVRLCVRPDAPSMTMNDPLHDCKPNARPFIFLGPVQPLENAEELVSVLHVKANAVVPDEIRR